jgi:hypothetical protein
MARVVRPALLLFGAALVVGVLGCGQASPSPSTPTPALPSVGESVTVGPLEYRLTAEFTPDPGSSDRERLTVSLLLANTSETTATLKPMLPEFSVVGSDESSATLLSEGTRESEGWGVPLGSHSGDITATLAPGGYFRFDEFVFAVAKGATGLAAHVRAQPGRDVTLPIR